MTVYESETVKKDDRSVPFRAEKAPLFRRFTQFKTPYQTVGIIDLGNDN